MMRAEKLRTRISMGRMNRIVQCSKSKAVRLQVELANR